MFGYERGAFTGAERKKPGKFELAHEGTLFLDEIGELPLPLQAKLLHVLQDREFARLGGEEVIRVDVRIVAATNRRLPELVRAGAFREDLYYRLNVIPIEVPPLRERREAIPELAMRVMERACREYGRPPVPLSREVLDQLTAYSWPGNVRELENLVRRIVVFGAAEPFANALGHSSTDPLADSSEATAIRTQVTTSEPEEIPVGARGLQDIVRRTALAAEAHALMETLNRVRWNRGAAARVLGISYKTLNRKMKQHGLRKTLLGTRTLDASLLSA
jgi:transcriptional regulator with GAF, ATPase, and Fis domain